MDPANFARSRFAAVDPGSEEAPRIQAKMEGVLLCQRVGVLRAEIADLSELLADVERRHRRHFLWTVIGFSPSAVIPAAGMALGHARGPLAALVLLLVAREGWRTVTTGREARRLRGRIADLEDELDIELAEC